MVLVRAVAQWLLLLCALVDWYVRGSAATRGGRAPLAVLLADAQVTDASAWPGDDDEVCPCSLAGRARQPCMAECTHRHAHEGVDVRKGVRVQCGAKAHT